MHVELKWSCPNLVTSTILTHVSIINAYKVLHHIKMNIHVQITIKICTPTLTRILQNYLRWTLKSHHTISIINYWIAWSTALYTLLILCLITCILEQWIFIFKITMKLYTPTLPHFSQPKLTLEVVLKPSCHTVSIIFSSKVLLFIYLLSTSHICHSPIVQYICHCTCDKWYPYDILLTQYEPQSCNQHLAKSDTVLYHSFYQIYHAL